MEIEIKERIFGSILLLLVLPILFILSIPEFIAGTPKCDVCNEKLFRWNIQKYVCLKCEKKFYTGW